MVINHANSLDFRLFVIVGGKPTIIAKNIVAVNISSVKLSEVLPFRIDIQSEIVTQYSSF